MAHEDNVPEPDEDMDHYVHMHIDYSDGTVVTDAEEREFGIGVVHMHVHGVPMNNFIETLLMLAVQTTAQAMLKGAEDEDGQNPLQFVPASMREYAADQMARTFLAGKIKTSESKAQIFTPVPDDASELFTEEQ